MESTNRRLMWHGMFLFLMGLLTGFAEQHFVNTRMGLAAHLEGVMNGTFLVVLGAVWTEVRLSSRPKVIAYWTALSGTYGNWFVTTLAATFGTAALSPITGSIPGSLRRASRARQGTAHSNRGRRQPDPGRPQSAPSFSR